MGVAAQRERQIQREAQGVKQKIVKKSNFLSLICFWLKSSSQRVVFPAETHPFLFIFILENSLVAYLNFETIILFRTATTQYMKRCVDLFN